MSRVLKSFFGNPSSLYKKAVESAVILDESRLVCATTIHAISQEIIFTGSASEANNMVIKSVADNSNKKRILSTPIEHASVIKTLEYLGSKGFEIVFIPIDSTGRIIVSEFEKLLDDNTMLVCCMYANNETGVIQDIQLLSKLAHSKNIPIFADCVQALGKIPVDVNELGVDYASFSAHKINGPKGVGMLYVRSNMPIHPFIHGGHQEHELRAGTESLHNIAGFAEACKAIQNMPLKMTKLSKQKEFFISEIYRIKPDAIITSPQNDFGLPNTINVSFPGINNAHIIAVLNFFNISVSAGSACNTQSNDPSHVLKAVGLTDQQARESVRFSMSSQTSWGDLRYTLQVISKFIQGKFPPIEMYEPKILNEDFLFSADTYILDVRFWYDRVLVKGIPNSNEIPFFTFKKFLKQIPHDKQIVVVCQGGYNAPIVAFELALRGYKRVGFLTLGILGWKQSYPLIYEKYGNQNIKKLK